MVLSFLVSLSNAGTVPEDIPQSVMERLGNSGWTVRSCSSAPSVRCEISRKEAYAVVVWSLDPPEQGENQIFTPFEGGNIIVRTALDGKEAQEALDLLLPDPVPWTGLSNRYLKSRATSLGWKGDCPGRDDDSLFCNYFTGEVHVSLRGGGRATNATPRALRGVIDGRGTLSFGLNSWRHSYEKENPLTTRYVRIEVRSTTLAKEIASHFSE